MARDEALLTLVRERGGGWLRFYGWSLPVLSLGRHQRARGIYDPGLAAERGIGIVRRPTGGRAVLHNREITYAAAAPVQPGETLRDAAGMVDRLLVSALARLGVDTSVARPDARAPAPDAAPCFALPVRGELLAGERKLVGSAQWREDDAWLQHGSILVDDDQGLIAELALVPEGQQPGELATLRELLGRSVSTGELTSAVLDVLRQDDEFVGEVVEAEHDIHERLEEIAVRLQSRYEDDSWTWRR